jgi:ferredoxin-fold anticodon binding domain-containing protein
LVWFKRLLPILIIGAAWFGYQQWQLHSDKKRGHEEQRIALVTAQVWVATATYQHDPERFLVYRDSLLKVIDVEVEDLYKYLERYENRPEQYLPFALRVSRYVDSLARIQDSILRYPPDTADDTSAADTVQL